MPDLGDLQKRLNRDQKLRDKFFLDPSGLVKAEGINLSKEQADDLDKAVSLVTARRVGVMNYQTKIQARQSRPKRGTTRKPIKPRKPRS
jgi:hypothetical protein